jgi:hypothetical protein
LILIASVASSCNKNVTVANLATVVDATNVGMQMDVAMEDVANVVGRSVLSGSTATIDTVIGGTLDTSQIANGIITINYDGTTTVSSRFIRGGSITIKLVNYPATHWSDQNAVLDVHFSELKFTNVASNGVYIYNGSNTLTNISVSGGLSYQILATPTTNVVHYRHICTADSITFPGGTTLVWNVNRIRTYTNNSATPQISVSSDETINGYSGAEIWGTSRQGYQFYYCTSTAAFFNSTICNSNFLDPASGTDRLFTQTFNIRITFGTNSSGGLVYNTCPWGYQTDYQNSINNANFSAYQYWY